MGSKPITAEELFTRIEALRERALELARPPEGTPQPDLLAETLEKLDHALEGLQVAEEELRQQNDELLTTRQALDAERQRYRDLSDFAPDGYLVTDLNGVIQETNQAAAQQLNVSPDYLTGKPLVLYVSPEAHREFRSRLSRLNQRGEAEDWEVKLQPRDRLAFNAALTVAPARTENGQVTALRWLLRDVSERVQAEEQIRGLNAELEQRVIERTAQLEKSNHDLRRREGELTDFVENASVGLHWVGPDGVILWANQCEMDLLGYSRDEYIGHPIAEFHADRQAIEDTLGRLAQGETVQQYEARLRCKDGSFKHVLVNSNVLWEAGQFVHTRCFTHDITQRKQAEQRLRLQYAVTHTLADTASPDEVTPRLLQAVCQELGWQFGALWRVDRTTGQLHNAGTWRAPELAETEFERVSQTRTFAPGVGLPGRVWTQDRAVWLPDVVVDSNFPRAPFAAKAGLRGAVGFPIRAGGLVTAVLEFFSREVHPPNPHLLELFNSLGDQVGNFIERRRVEAALRLNEERFRIAIGNLPVAVFNQDGDLRYTWVYNPPHSFTLAQMLGRTDADLFPPEDAERLAALKRQVLASGQRLHEELWVTANQQTRYYTLTLEPLRDPWGQVAGVLGAAIDITDHKKAEEAQRLLAEAGKALSSSLDFAVRLANLARLVVPALADWCTIHLLQADRSIYLIAADHADPARRGLINELQSRYPLQWDSPQLVPQVLRTGEPILISELRDDMAAASPLPEGQLALLRQLGVRSVMILPLVAHGHMLGALTLVAGESGRRYGPEDLAFGEALARRAALSVDNARLYEAEQQARQAADTINQHLARLQMITATLSEALTLAQVAEVIVTQGVSALGAAAGSVVLKSETGDALEVIGSVGYPAELLERWRRFPLDTGTPLGQAVLSGEPVLLESREAAGDHARLVVKNASPESQAWAAIPLVVEGRAIGAMGLSFNQPRPFGSDDRGFMLAIARQCAQALERARLYAETQALNVELDQRVAKRTAELVATNRRLTKEIGERQQAEAALNASNQMWQTLVQASPLAIMVLDEQTRVKLWNPAAERMFGWSEQEILEQALPSVPEEAQAEFYAQLSASLSGQPLVRYESRRRRKDGALIEVSLWATPLYNFRGAKVASMALIADITERKRAETVLRQSREQLRALSGRLQAAREEERTLMAREIHDRLGGDLTALKIDLAWLQSRVRGRNQNAMLVKLNTMSALLDDSIQAVRKIATELRPGILDDLGLIAAIEWQLNEFQARTGVACAFTTGLEDSPIDPDGTTTLFRILQEALTNIARHANATRVEVGLEPVPSYLVLSVRDNGRGINEAEINSSHSLGLLGMRERARLQAGDLQVAGRPGQGTTITVRLPIRSQGLAEESLGDPSPAC